MTKPATLPGTPADWTVKLVQGQLMLSSPKYPTKFMSPRPVVFEEDLIFDVVNDKFVPRVALPGAEHPLIVKLRKAGLDPDVLAAAMR